MFPVPGTPTKAEEWVSVRIASPGMKVEPVPGPMVKPLDYWDGVIAAKFLSPEYLETTRYLI